MPIISQIRALSIDITIQDQSFGISNYVKLFSKQNFYFFQQKFYFKKQNFYFKKQNYISTFQADFFFFKQNFYFFWQKLEILLQKQEFYQKSRIYRLEKDTLGQLYLLKLKLDELNQLRNHLKTFDFKPNSSMIDDSRNFYLKVEFIGMPRVLQPNSQYSSFQK